MMMMTLKHPRGIRRYGAVGSVCSEQVGELTVVISSM
jgi:hypothetical protein